MLVWHRGRLYKQIYITNKYCGQTNYDVDKLKAFTEGVASAIDKFANIRDPAVQAALTAISRELYMLCDVEEKLDLDKLNKLENINIGGVQTEIKILRKLGPSDPFMDGDVIEGQMKPKLMIADTCPI